MTKSRYSFPIMTKTKNIVKLFFIHTNVDSNGLQKREYQINLNTGVEAQNRKLARITLPCETNKKGAGINCFLSVVHYKSFLSYGFCLFLYFRVETLLLRGNVSMYFNLCCWVHFRSCKVWLFSKFERLQS